VRFEVFTAGKIKMFFWVVTPRGLASRYRVSQKHAVSIFRVEERLEVIANPP
jgi:hypothetical protein